MRALVPVVALSALSLVACGGRLNPDDGCPDDRCVDGGFETGLPDSSTSDTMPDTPGTCGSGACTPGASCKLDCNTCRCSPSGEWGCTVMACLDSGPDFGFDTGPTCPPGIPPAGAACAGSLYCTYSNGCGGSTYAACSAGRWAVKSDPCVTPSCPTSEPVEGTPCKGPVKCGYTNSCGGFDTAYCDGSTGTVWKVLRGDCPPPPPPPPVCPTTKPAAFSVCSGFANCGWDNGCGGITYGYCDGKYWNLKDSPCTPGCPGAKPTSGAACKPTPSGLSCSYISVPGTTCTSSCFCADDGRWACLTPPCTGTGGGVPPGG